MISCLLLEWVTIKYFFKNWDVNHDSSVCEVYYKAK